MKRAVDRCSVQREDTILSGVDTGGRGPAVLFEHGLGADESQIAEIFPGEAGFRRLTLECRGHGNSTAGEAQRFAIATFADDALAFLNSRGVTRFAVGGLSMGAAVALRLAITSPERVSALVLARPAWLSAPAPKNMRFFTEVGALIRDHGREAGGRLFERSDSARQLKTDAPDNLVSLIGFFSPERPPWTSSLLLAIAADGPGIDDAAVEQIAVPTLVISHARDLIHPLDYARILVERIPNAELVEITPKATDLSAYRREFRAALEQFLHRHLISSETATR